MAWLVASATVLGGAMATLLWPALGTPATSQRGAVRPVAPLSVARMVSARAWVPRTCALANPEALLLASAAEKVDPLLVKWTPTPAMGLPYTSAARTTAVAAVMPSATTVLGDTVNVDPFGSTAPGTKVTAPCALAAAANDAVMSLFCAVALCRVVA